MAPSEDTKYYDILEISKTAGESEIRKAYKKMAWKYHPDRNAGDPQAQEKFKQVTEAYEVLSDPKKRSVYDKYGYKGLKEGGGMPFGSDPMGIFKHFFFGGDDEQEYDRGPRKGQPVVQALPVSLEEMYNGAVRKMRITRTRNCSSCEGTGATKRDAVERCKDCSGKGRKTVVQQLGPGFVQQYTSTCPTCKGEGKQIKDKFKCKKCGGKKITGEPKILEIHIDRGMKEGQKIVFEGEADERPDMLPGDVIFVLQQKEHPQFQRDANNNLLMNKKINLLEALTGTEFKVTHLDGRNLICKTKRGKVVKPGETLQVDNEGMPLYKSPFEKGNLLIKFEVEFPEKIPPQFVKKLEEILPSKQKTSDVEKNAKIVEEVFLNDLTADTDARSHNGKRKEAYEEEDEEMEDEARGNTIGCRTQ